MSNGTYHDPPSSGITEVMADTIGKACPVQLANLDRAAGYRDAPLALPATTMAQLTELPPGAAG
jgi:hypothetical protein